MRTGAFALTLLVSIKGKITSTDLRKQGNKEYQFLKCYECVVRTGALALTLLVSDLEQN